MQFARHDNAFLGIDSKIKIRNKKVKKSKIEIKNEKNLKSKYATCTQ